MADHEDGHAPADSELERYGRYRVPRQRPLVPDLSPGPIQRGRKPGSRYVRVTPSSERPFLPLEEGGYRATDAAMRPRGLAESALRQLKRALVGAPLATSETEEQKIPKVKALAVFSSDALSSSAYATDEILLVLVAAGAGALTHSIEIALAIGALLAIVTFSYRQTIRAYPNGGGAYIVARENLGNAAGLSAAAALSVDYILTVAVSVAAGVFAITSAFPEIQHLSVEVSVVAVALITLANLRGIRESSTIFAIPTYVFIASFFVLIVAGFVRILLDPGLSASVPDSALAAGSASLSPFLILRAFASGSAALTGVEAISNGIPAFKKPESRNAATTLTLMAGILAIFFIGLTVLAHQLGVRHADEISVPAQIAATVFGKNIVFYVIQASTALILLLAANTSYADFPRLGSILARDRFLPHQFAFRGDRLGFSHGIIVLGAASSALLILFGADVDRLIPLYAFGVFVSFTLSQSGMVVHWLRLRGPGWKQSAAVNGVGAVATAVVALIVGATKFADGAWISMLLMAILALLLAAVHRHYGRFQDRVQIGEREDLPPDTRHSSLGRNGLRGLDVIVPIDEVNRPALQAFDYARSVSSRVSVVHVTDEAEHAEALRRRWSQFAPDAPLVVIESPYRSFLAPMLAYIDAIDRTDPDGDVAVVLSRLVPAHFWQQPLHNQSAAALQKALSHRPRTIIIEVPYLLDGSDA